MSEKGKRCPDATICPLGYHNRPSTVPEEQGEIPCRGCNVGWGSHSQKGVKSCHDTCKLLKDFIASSIPTVDNEGEEGSIFLHTHPAAERKGLLAMSHHVVIHQEHLDQALSLRSQLEASTELLAVRAEQITKRQGRIEELEEWKEGATGELIEAGKGLGITAESLLEAQAKLERHEEIYEKRIADLKAQLNDAKITIQAEAAAGEIMEQVSLRYKAVCVEKSKRIEELEKELNDRIQELEDHQDSTIKSDRKVIADLQIKLAKAEVELTAAKKYQKDLLKRTGDAYLEVSGELAKAEKELLRIKGVLAAETAVKNKLYEHLCDYARGQNDAQAEVVRTKNVVDAGKRLIKVWDSGRSGPGIGSSLGVLRVALNSIDTPLPKQKLVVRAILDERAYFDDRGNICLCGAKDGADPEKVGYPPYHEGCRCYVEEKKKGDS